MQLDKYANLQKYFFCWMLDGCITYMYRIDIRVQS